MLNLLRTSVASTRHVRQELLTVSGVGLSMGLLGLWHFENQAALALHLASTTASTHAVQAVQAIQAKPNLSVNHAAVLAQAQQNKLASLARLAYLDRRQSQREDLTEVQETWLLSRLGSTQNMLKLQSQQFHQGQFTWEGVAVQSIDLDGLVHTLNRFQRWQQAPVLVQMQAESADPSAGLRKGQIFQVQAVLQPAAGGGL